MPTSSAISLIVIRLLCKIIFLSASMFSVITIPMWYPAMLLTCSGDQKEQRHCRLLGLPCFRLCDNWTCILLTVDSPNTTVNISNVLAHLISFFTQNLIQLIQAHLNMTKLYNLSKTNWPFKVVDIINIYNRHVYELNRKENVTYEIWK